MMVCLNEDRSVRLEVNLDNLAFNMRQVRKIVGNKVLIMAVVKANAYGHGSTITSKVFLENGADRLAVSTLEEGIELRKVNINCDIMLLNYTSPKQYKKILKYNVIPNVFRYEDAKILSEMAVESEVKVKIHIKIDTEMSRVGFLPTKESIRNIIKINRLPGIEVEGIFTHFSSSDEKDKTFTHNQYDKFNWVIKELKANNVYIAIKHISNSAAILDMPQYNLDMVRPGNILYGYYPSDYVKKDRMKIKPSLALKAEISNIIPIKKGTNISYNNTFITKKDSIIATLPIGFADGCFRVLSNRGEISINGVRAPIVGKICMDQFMVDVTHIKDVHVGDEAVLFGYEFENHPSVEEIAGLANTISDEVICKIGRRVPRIYIKDKHPKYILDYLLY